MKPVFRLSAAAIVAIAAQAAFADTATTKGGFQIKSDDGVWEAKLGGRIHLDANVYIDDKDYQAPDATDPYREVIAKQQAAAGIPVNGDKTDTTLFFRRAQLTMEGRAYDWKYKFDYDFMGPSSSNSNGIAGFRDLWVGRTLDGGYNLRIGQANPYRSMEEILSSNEILMMERPFSSASGIYSGRQFVQGVFVDKSGDIPNSTIGYGYGISAYNTRGPDATNTSSGMGYSGRVWMVPLREEGQVVHLGLSASSDRNPYNTTLTTPSNDFRLRPRLVGREVAMRPTLVGDNIGQTAVGLEAAYRNGPVYLQAEYARAKYDVVNAAKNAAGNVQGVYDSLDQDVNTYYIQGSYVLNGSSRPYNIASGTFRAPRSENGSKPIELKARYDHIDTEQNVVGTGGVATGKTGKIKGDQWVVGVNYYATPQMRWMLEYVNGKYDSDNPQTVTSTAANGSRTTLSADKTSYSANLIQARLQYVF